VSAQFAEAARRLAGMAGAMLGWRPDEFWRATPDELAAIIEAMAGEAPPVAGGADIARLKEMFPDG
jgi:hypothetical protein